MKISATEEYGLRCLLRVARQPADSPISAQQIAQLEGISTPYAQKLLRVLTQAELVEARRGSSGGYVMAREVSILTLGDAIRALGGMVELDTLCEHHTGQHDVCCNTQNCTIRPVWSFLSEFLARTLDAIPLALLLSQEDDVARFLRAMTPPKAALTASLPTPHQCPIAQAIAP